MAKKLIHAGECGGAIKQAEILDDGRMWGQCLGGCIDNHGWVVALPDGKLANLTPATVEDKELIRLASDKLFAPVHRHVGPYSWQGKIMYGDTCDCKFCVKERKKMEPKITNEQ